MSQVQRSAYAWPNRIANRETASTAAFTGSGPAAPIGAVIVTAVLAFAASFAPDGTSAGSDASRSDPSPRATWARWGRDGTLLIGEGGVLRAAAGKAGPAEEAAFSTCPFSDVCAAASSGGGATVVTGHRDGVVRVWHGGGFSGPPAEFRMSGAWVTASAVTADGVGLAGWDDGTVAAWRTDTGRVLWRRDGRPTVNDVALTADGAVAALIGDDGTVCCVRTADGSSTMRFGGAGDMVRAAAFGPCGRRLLLGHYFGAVSCRDLDSGRECWRAEPDRPGMMVHPVAVSGDGATAAAYRPEGVRVFSMATGRLIRGPVRIEAGCAALGFPQPGPAPWIFSRDDRMTSID